MTTKGLAGSEIRRNRTDAEHFDVIIVGARCAGSPLATLLSRAGLKVVVVEQATFPREVLSSHLMEADGLLFLKRLGVLDSVEKTGVRFMRRADTKLNDFHVVSQFPLRFDDVGGATFLRRHLLDSILHEAAVEAGADVRMGTKVVEMIWERGRVAGVRAQHDGKETVLRAPLVVGADGRNSTVAYMVGSRKYNVVPNERSYYFTFFEGAHPSSDDTFVFHRWGDRMVWAGPADNGLYLVGVSPEGHEREYFRRNTEAGLLAHMRSCEPTAEALADAKIATKISGIVKFEGYFRQSSGPGWVLVGDAGHFKDPSAGRGIGDAFRQVERLAPAIVAALGRSGPGVSALGQDETLRQWTQWRDRRFEGHYWLANILGEAGALPAAVPEALKGMAERGEIGRFLDLYHHRSKYYEVFPLTDMAVITGRMMLSGKHKRLPLVRETVKLLAREPRRRWINRHPQLVSSDVTAAPPVRVRPVPSAAADPLPAPAPQNGSNGSAGANGTNGSNGSAGSVVKDADQKNAEV
ncbi:NAD(P)/FAD-dependent oxidoreductase [Streptomyces sp. NPDC093221]|uniref:NAD(P)/FAD-dependent oxidoreductase n=1 Tax=Streptomyces sp. NPDC093221 TaxID=3366032 RepID=UPI003808C6B9